MKRVIVALVLIVGVFAPIMINARASAITGSDWRAGHIIDEAIFFNKNAFSVEQIQDFLYAKVAPANTTPGTKCHRYHTSIDPDNQPPFVCLYEYQENTETGENNAGRVNQDGTPYQVTGGKGAAQILWEVGQSYNINPQVLIVLIQKEQGLVTDNWPWLSQYEKATGYSCPDTAPCNSMHSGFYRQVVGAAWQFRRYMEVPSYFNYDVGTNNIYYNPSASCGASAVNIVNRATAMLYNYTPYQPNQAALDNMYGIGDSCSAYGNRNFWRYFNDWFGTTYDNSFTLAMSDDGSQTQYVVYGNLKQAIPSIDIKLAWGLERVNLVTLPGSYINSLSNGPPLDRQFVASNDAQLFFVDNGNKYRVTSWQVSDAWNLTGRVISHVPPGLANIPLDGGSLGYAFTNPNTTAIYAVEGGDNNGELIARQYASPDLLTAWEGESPVIMNLSDSLFASLTRAVGPPLTTTKVIYAGKGYEIVSGQRMYMPGFTSSLYPGVGQPISSAAFNRLIPTANVNHLIRAAGSPDVYLVDGGFRHYIGSQDILNTWSFPGARVNVVNRGFINLIPRSQDITTHIARAGSQTYVMSSYKRPVPSDLEVAYVGSMSIYSASEGLMTLFPLGDDVSDFIQSSDSQKVALLDNSSFARPFDTVQSAKMWGVTSKNVTILPSYIISKYPVGSKADTYVSDTTGAYIVMNGSLLPVSTRAASDWGLSSPQLYADGSLARFNIGDELGSRFRSGRSFIVANKGIAYTTIDRNIAEAWGALNVPEYDLSIVERYLHPSMMTRFAGSSIPGDKRLFVADRGTLYHMTPAGAENLGLSKDALMLVAPEDISMGAITSWTWVLAQDDSGKAYVIDGGGKRYFPNDEVKNYWTNGGAVAPFRATNGFLNLLPTAGKIERTVKGSSPATYLVEGGQKRWILSPYDAPVYFPLLLVSDRLINALPVGPAL